MKHPLQTHIQRYISFPDEDFSEVITYFTPIEIDKKQNLLAEGKTCRANYFVLKGCLRLFFINEKGGEQTTHFALENWWLSDYQSLASQTPSQFSIQAVEKSSLLALDRNREEEMFVAFPQMERYFRLVQQRANAAAQFRIRTLYGLSKEDSYRLFYERYPEFVQRVPQYLLASYLGFTPEYLSEIRKKKK